ncbi:hypothetical protein KCP77_23290 [Salmonella enterica subsp. enterica]|nr:hypothetical protein KCP77_23290 [Salmonella enterica subsp. enterica]
MTRLSTLYVAATSIRHRDRPLYPRRTDARRAGQITQKEELQGNRAA